MGTCFLFQEKQKGEAGRGLTNNYFVKITDPSLSGYWVAVGYQILISGAGFLERENGIGNMFGNINRSMNQ